VLRGVEALERGAKVAVVPSSLNPYGLHATLRILAPSAEAAGARLEAVTPSSCGEGVTADPDTSFGEVEAVEVLRLERVYAAEAAKLVGASVALLPVDATTLSAIALEALLSGRLDYLADQAAAVYTVRGVKVAYPLSAVEAEAVAAYAALTGGRDCAPPWRPVFRFKHVFRAATAGRGPELLYGGLASARRLAEALARREGDSCASCGAPGYRGLCPTCERLGLHGFRLVRSG